MYLEEAGSQHFQGSRLRSVRGPVQPIPLRRSKTQRAPFLASLHLGPPQQQHPLRHQYLVHHRRLVLLPPNNLCLHSVELRLAPNPNPSLRSTPKATHSPISVMRHLPHSHPNLLPLHSADPHLQPSMYPRLLPPSPPSLCQRSPWPRHQHHHRLLVQIVVIMVKRKQQWVPQISQMPSHVTSLV